MSREFVTRPLSLLLYILAGTFLAVVLDLSGVGEGLTFAITMGVLSFVFVLDNILRMKSNIASSGFDKARAKPVKPQSEWWLARGPKTVHYDRVRNAKLDEASDIFGRKLGSTKSESEEGSGKHLDSQKDETKPIVEQEDFSQPR